MAHTNSLSTTNSLLLSSTGTLQTSSLLNSSLNKSSTLHNSSLTSKPLSSNLHPSLSSNLQSSALLSKPTSSGFVNISSSTQVGQSTTKSTSATTSRLHSSSSLASASSLTEHAVSTSSTRPLLTTSSVSTVPLTSIQASSLGSGLSAHAKPSTLSANLTSSVSLGVSSSLKGLTGLGGAISSRQLNTDVQDEESIFDTNDFFTVLSENGVPLVISFPSVKPSEYLKGRSLDEFQQLKEAFVNLVSGSLLNEPKFYKVDDATRLALTELAVNVAVQEPEFLVKLALYCRDDLGIRTTANFLLALCAHLPACRAFLAKYFNASIRLPSDWMEVAELYRTFELDGDPFAKIRASRPSFPAALRKVMISKFPEFDVYQLAKYNKDKQSAEVKNKNKAKKLAEMKERREKKGLGFKDNDKQKQVVPRDAKDSDADSDSDDEEDADKDQDASKKSDRRPAVKEDFRCTIKYLIRLLHISEPVEPTMAILGKTYPETRELFMRSRLPGEFDEAKAGKRMKLPTPETWETEVSLKGNKAEVWQSLLDHKKLPFMAMLRNLRNMLIADISDRHHTTIVKRLSSETSVVNSRQFPSRFLSAYEALKQAVEEARKARDKTPTVPEGETSSEGTPAVAPGRGRGRGRGGRGTSDNRGARGGSGARQGSSAASESASSSRGGKSSRGGRGGKSKGGADATARKPRKDVDLPENPWVPKYLQALETAIMLAARYNIKPIRGRTILLMDINETMMRLCSSAKGLGKPMTLQAVGLLLGLMCKFSCEDCEFVLFDNNNHFLIVQPTTSSSDGNASILANISILEEKANQLRGGEVASDASASSALSAASSARVTTLPAYLDELLLQRIIVDSVVVVTDHGEVSDSTGETQAERILSFTREYRTLVRPQMLFVNIDLSGGLVGVLRDNTDRHPNDIYVSGYSDQILRFIADRGDGQQIAYINTIDSVKQLDIRPKKDVPRKHRASVIGKAPRKVKSDQSHATHTGTSSAGSSAQTPLLIDPLSDLPNQWRTARVFISSTFVDMHSERNILAKVVFPQLRERCHQHRIHLFEIDLRWGITQGEAENNRSLQLCLEEIDRSRPFFLGLLGNRYGYVPSDYVVESSPKFDWLTSFPPNRSITELEFVYGALESQGLTGKQSQSVICLRDPNVAQQVPEEAKALFVSTHQREIDALKDRVRRFSSNFPQHCTVIDNYKAKWGGTTADGTATLSGLDAFQSAVTEALWRNIQQEFGLVGAAAKASSASDLVDGGDKKDLEEEKALQAYAIEQASFNAVGRAAVIKRLFEFVDSDVQRNPLVVTSKPGYGKTSVLAKFVKSYAGSPHHLAINLLSHFVGISKESADLRFFLWQLSHEIIARYPLPKNTVVPQDVESLLKFFPDLVRKASQFNRIVIVIDALDNFDNTYGAHNLQWLQFVQQLPSDRVRVIVSVVEKGLIEKSLRRWSPEPKQVVLAPLETQDKTQLVRQTLALHRKKLDESPFNNQMRMLLTKRDAGNPLYLALACHELRLFGVFEQMGTKLRELASSVGDLVMSMLQRIEADIGQALVKRALSFLSLSRHGLLETELIVLLRRKEEDALPQAVWAALYSALRAFLRIITTKDNKLQLVHVDTITAVRHRYLATNDGLVKYHGYLASFFLAQANLEYHRIADATASKVVPVNRRALNEVAYHLSEAGRWKELGHILTDLVFIELRCKVGQAHEILAEIDKLLGAKAALKHINVVHLQSMRSFVAKNAHVVSTYPTLTLQQALNSPDAFVRQSAETLYMQRGSSSRYIHSHVLPNSDSDSCLMTLLHQTEPVYALAVTKDFSLLAAGTADGSCRLFSVKTGAEQDTLRGSGQPVTALLFLDATRLVAGYVDGSLRIWDITKSALVSDLKGHTRRISAIVATLDQKALVSASWDCNIMIWNAVTGEQQNTLHGLPAPVSCLDAHPDGQRIIYGFWNGTLQVYDVLHQRSVFKLERHRGSVRSVAFAPSGRHAVSGDSVGIVKIWSMLSGKQVGSYQAHAGPVNALSYSPSGNQLRTVGQDGQARVWSGNLGVLNHTLLQNASVQQGSQRCRSVAISHDQDVVAAAYSDGSLRIFSIDDGKLISHLELHPNSINSVSWGNQTNFRRFVTASDDGTCAVVELPPPSKQTRQRSKNDYTAQGTVRLVGHADIVNCASFSPNDNLIATASNDLAVRVFNPTGVIVATLRGHSAFVTSVAFASSNDQLFLLSSSRDFSVVIWSAKDFSLVRTLVNCHPDWINSVVADASIFFTASNDFTIRQWSLTDLSKPSEDEQSNANNALSPLKTLSGHMAIVNSIAFSAGFLLSASSDGEAKLWSKDGAEVTTLHGHSLRVNSVDLSLQRDRKVAATASDDGSVCLWDPFQGSLVQFANAHSQDATAIVGAGTNTFASTSLDGTVKLWSSNDYAPTVERSPRHRTPVSSVAISSSGDLIASVARDASVMVWQRVSNNKLVCLASFKLHETSGAANAVVFLEDPQSAAAYRTTSVLDKVTIAVGANDGSLTVWQASSRTSSNDASSSNLMPTLVTKVADAHDNAIVSLSFSRSSNRVLSAGWDRRVRSFVWNGRALTTDTDDECLHRATSSIRFATEDSSGNVLAASAALGGQVSILKHSRGAMTVDATVKVPSAPLDVAFVDSPATELHAGGPILFIARADGTVSAIAHTTGATLSERCTHHGAARAVGVSNDGRVVFTGGSDSIVRVSTWRKSVSGQHELYVAGVFHLAGTCTSLAAAPSGQDFVVGDALGHVYALTWVSSSSS